MIQDRELYKITLYWDKEIIIFNRHAVKEEKAVDAAIRGLEKQKGLRKGEARGYILVPENPRFRVEKIKLTTTS